MPDKPAAPMGMPGVLPGQMPGMMPQQNPMMMMMQMGVIVQAILRALGVAQRDQPPSNPQPWPHSDRQSANAGRAARRSLPQARARAHGLHAAYNIPRIDR